MLDLMIPFNAVNGDRIYDAEDIAAMLASVITDGVHPSPGTSMMVKALGGWQLGIQPGRCAVKGHIGVNASEKPLTVIPPDGALPRIDAAVIRCDLDARTIEERLIKGEPASQPSTPSLQRDDHAWELMLARIAVAPTATGIGQMDITDTRWNAAVCGVMHSLTEVGAEGLFAQFEAAWAEWFEGVQQESEGWQDGAFEQFEDWLSTVQGLLDDNAAAQLASAVAILQADVENLAESQEYAIYEKARETGSIDPGDWAVNETLGLWQATAAHPAVTYTDSDVAVIISADSLKEPVMGSGAAGSGTVTLYAARKPARTVNYTVIVTGIRI
ncbi:MAG: hypothetical protein LBK46_07140 [Oscillospiraceae bacterium]|jgi:phosphatidylglycerophosphatase A|nr:hypothetical protein [Oscillospiraceae bacterium]